MPVGIVTNTSALKAQANLNKASTETQASVSRLSSGSRIDKASTDVAGLAIGTILQTNVSTLKSAFTNTAQANSLLGVADGALKNIGEILQRQKALATQATSGSLSSSARAFLDAEFQNLTKEIDRISDTTNFNGITLIDGSLYTPSKMLFKTENASTRAEGILEIVNPLADAETLTLTVNGYAVVFTTRALATYGTGDIELELDLANNATATAQMDHLKAKIDGILAYTGTDVQVLDAKAALSAVEFEHTAATALMTVRARSGGIQGGAIALATSAAANDITLSGADVNAGVTLQADATAGVDNDLKGGTFATGGATAYAGTATTIAQGSRGDTIITAISATAATSGAGNGTGVSAAGISNNPDFVGTLPEFKATFISPDRVNLEMQVGEFTYKVKEVDTTPAADTIVRLSSLQAGGGFFDIQLEDATASGQAAVTNQAEADQFGVRLNKALSKVSFYQNREIENYVSAGTIFPTGSTTASGDLAGSSFKFIHNDFSKVEVSKVSVKAPVTGATNAEIEITINGEIYRSGFSNIGAVAALGTSIAASANIGFVNVNNPLSVLQFTNGGTAISLTNDAEAEGLQKALESAFGIKTGSAGGLSFQVGTNASDIIGVQVESTKTEDIYLNDKGFAAELSIDSLLNATTAQGILDSAINKVTALRANIGALQSRFDYAASNIESSIQNQDAARSVFLDADTAAESTNFAQSQVRMNASISVLAQANQMPQNLLKLIG